MKLSDCGKLDDDGDVVWRAVMRVCLSI